MARKQSEKQLQNLKPFKKGDKRTKECSAKGKKVIKENNLIRGGMRNWLKENVDDKDYQQMMKNLVERAKVDTKTFEVLRDTLGEKPTDKLEATIEQPTFIEDLND